MRTFWQGTMFSLLFFCLSSCGMRQSVEQDEFYAHLSQPHEWKAAMREDDYFLILLVEARHLDYTTAKSFFRSMSSHSTLDVQTGAFGHAWIYLQGKHRGERLIIEGGHTGEIDKTPRYFDQVMDAYERGDPNPIRYLWEERQDGFFQKGAGGHCPTFAAKVSLSEEQFYRLLHFIHPHRYDYRSYALVGKQCTSFVREVAALAGLSLESDVTMTIDPTVYYGRCWLRLWEDPSYASITFSSPDQLEKSLMQAVCEGEAEYALDWYKLTVRKDYPEQFP